jgi:hypothetical protein
MTTVAGTTSITDPQGRCDPEGSSFSVPVCKTRRDPCRHQSRSVSQARRSVVDKVSELGTLTNERTGAASTVLVSDTVAAAAAPMVHNARNSTTPHHRLRLDGRDSFSDELGSGILNGLSKKRPACARYERLNELIFFIKPLPLHPLHSMMIVSGNK